MTDDTGGRPALFLDRDGTINVEKKYLYKPEDLEFIPNAAEAIKRLNDIGYLVIVVSNQAGIARGYFAKSDVDKFHEYLDGELAKSGARIDAYYYCPHHPDFGDEGECACRKPSPGLILKAARDYDIALTRSYLVGDKAIDMEAAVAAGVAPIMVATGYGAWQRNDAPQGVRFVSDLMESLKEIKSSL